MSAVAPADTSAPLALVTGGLNRVGAAIAMRLARAGYALALHKRSAGDPEPALAAVLAETGADWAKFRGDLGNAADVAALVPAVAAHFGRAPDVLVNNASHFADSAWDSVTLDDLTTAMLVNHHAPVLLAQAVVRAAAPGQIPAIINILDQRIAQPVPDQLAYSLAKSALWQSTRTLAVAMAPRARVNAVAPGLTLPTEDFAAGQMERIAAHMPLGALPTPAQIADAVLYLAQAEAVTGQTLFVDGGASLINMGRDFVHLER